MKKLLKNFFRGLVFGIGMISIFGIFYLVKGRSGLTANSGDKLTASQWNNLVNQVNSMKRSTVSTSDTALFDTGCERKRQHNNGGTNQVLYTTAIYPNGQNIQYISQEGRYTMNYLSKTSMTGPGGTLVTLKLWKKCDY